MAPETCDITLPVRPSAADGGQQLAVLQALATVSTTAARLPGLDVVLDAVARAMADLIGVERSSLFLRDGRSSKFRGRAAVVQGDPDSNVERLVCGVAADGFTREILSQGAPVLVGDAPRDHRPVREAVRRWNLRSVLGVPLVAGDEVLGLFFLDDVTRVHRFRDGDAAIAATFSRLVAATVAQAQEADQLRETTDGAVRQNRHLRRQAALEERLTALSLDAPSLQAIVDATTGVLKQRCVFHDADDLHRMASSPASAEVRSPLDPGPEAPGIVRALHDSDRNRPAMIGPFRREGLRRRYLVARVATGARTWGYLVVAEDERRLSTVDSGIVRRAAELAAAQCAATQRVRSVAAHAGAALLRDLLGGTPVDAVLRERAALHGIDATGRSLLVRVEPQPAGDPPLRADDVLRAFEHCGPRESLIASSDADGHLLVLVPVDEQDTPTADAAAQVDAVRRAIASLPAAVAAVSSATRILDDGPAVLREVRDVMHALRSVGAVGGVLAANELGVGRSILAALDERGARRFAHQMLGPLLDDPSPGASDLLLTLDRYFVCCGNVRVAAAQMGMHGNTVRYRLGRIAKITGLDLYSSAEDQLGAQLAILILRLRGELPAAAEVQVEADAA